MFDAREEERLQAVLVNDILVVDHVEFGLG